MPAAPVCVILCAVLAAFGTVSSAWADEAVEDAVGEEAATSEEASAELSVSVHQQSIGWTEGVASGETAGTTGEDLRAEAIDLTLSADVEGSSSDVVLRAERPVLRHERQRRKQLGQLQRGHQLRRLQLGRLRERKPERGQPHRRRRPDLPLSRDGDCANSRASAETGRPFRRLCRLREFRCLRLACGQVVYTSPVHATTKTALGSAAAFRDEPHGLEGFGRPVGRFPSEQRG